MGLIERDGKLYYTGLPPKVMAHFSRRDRIFDVCSSVFLIACFILFITAMLWATLNAIVKTEELRVSREATLESIRKDWNCNADRCTFPGLDYSTPIDRRFGRAKN